jgi:hypothetical protein
MAYQPYDRNPSGIVFFGASATDQVFESDSNFSVDAANSQLKVPNIVLNDNGNIGNASQTGIISLGSDGVATFVSGVVIQGNLTVNGTQVVLNTETLNVEDNILVLNSNVTGSPSTDAGIEVERGDSTNVRFQWDEGEDYWAFTNNGSNYYPVGVARSGLIYDNTAGNKFFFDVGAGTGIKVDTNAVNIDITGLSELTTSDNDDVILIYDTDTATHKKITKSNFVSNLGGGTVTSVAVSGTDGIDVDSGSPITTEGTIVLGLSNVPNAALANSSFTISDGSASDAVSLGETLTFTGGTGIDVTVATNTATFSLDLSELSEAAIADGDSIVFIDSSDANNSKKESLADLVTLLAGAGLTSTNSVINVIGGDGITANANEIEVTVDNSTIELSASDGTGAIRVKDAGITEAKRSRTVDSAFTTGDTISSDINLVSGGAGGITVKLPAPISGKIVTVKKIDSAAGVVTVSQNASETIDGAASKALYYQYETLTFVSDGTNWFII